MKVIECGDPDIKEFISMFMGFDPRSLSMMNVYEKSGKVVQRLQFVGIAEPTIQTDEETTFTNTFITSQTEKGYTITQEAVVGKIEDANMAE